MEYKKLSVTLPSPLVERIERRKGLAPFSTYIAQLLDERMDEVEAAEDDLAASRAIRRRGRAT